MLRALLIALFLGPCSSRRADLSQEFVGNPGAIAAAVMMNQQRQMQVSNHHGSTSSGIVGPDPAELARRQAEHEQHARERATVYAASVCSKTLCEVGTKVELMRSISKGMDEGETATVMEHQMSNDMYTVKSDCQDLTVQVAAYMLQRSSSRKCPELVAPPPPPVQQVLPEVQKFDVGDNVVTTETRANFHAGEEGVVRKVVGDGNAYTVCLGGQIQKTLMGALMTGGTKCSGKEAQIAGRLLRPR